METYALKVLAAEKEKLTNGLDYINNSCLEGKQRMDALDKVIKRIDSLNEGISILLELCTQ